jgi:hypothetical protein
MARSWLHSPRSEGMGFWESKAGLVVLPYGCADVLTREDYSKEGSMATATSNTVLALVSKGEEPPVPLIIAAKEQIIHELETLNWAESTTWLKFQVTEPDPERYAFFGTRFDFAITLRKRVIEHYARRGLKIHSKIHQNDGDVFLYIRRW